MPDDFSGPISFEVFTPLTPEIVSGHIAHARSLDLPELFPELNALTIIASGPSARGAPLDGPTLALNGAIQLFLQAGRTPSYWAACDPQREVADFLPDDPPRDIAYLVASKCHPDVFAKLEGRDVRLWHVRDELNPGVPSASSITLTMMSAFFMLGIKRFDVYGWDCCFSPDGRHHANSQPGVISPEVTVECGDLTFQTTHTWANEIEAALYLIPLYEFFGCEVNIHGRSLIQAVRQHRK